MVIHCFTNVFLSLFFVFSRTKAGKHRQLNVSVYWRGRLISLTCLYDVVQSIMYVLHLHPILFILQSLMIKWAALSSASLSSGLLSASSSSGSSSSR
jgi:uncharacterized membrane protein